MEETFATKLKRRHKYLGYTQATTANILNLSPPRISEWECEIRTPKPLTQEAIFAKLGSRKKK